MMENGLIAEQGSYEELAKEGTRFNKLVRSQMFARSVPLVETPEVEEVQEEQGGEEKVVKSVL